MKFKILFLYLLSSLFFLSCKNDSKEKIIYSKATPYFTIKGNLIKGEAKTIVLLEKNTKAYRTIATAVQTQDRFSIVSYKELPVKTYYLKIDQRTNLIPILVDNSEIEVQLNFEELSESIVVGSSSLQKEYKRYREELKGQKDKFIYRKKIVEDNLTSDFGAIVLNEMLGETAWRLGQTKLLFEKLSKEVQTSDLGHEIRDYIVKSYVKLGNSKKNDENISKQEPQNSEEVSTPKETIIKEDLKKPLHSKPTITNYAPYFYAFDLSGTEVSAKTIFNKNKLVLVDFWASWCAPCRAQHPDFLRLYNKYHAKGFEIISVAQDKKNSNSQVAITEDNMRWINLIDNHKAVANMYQVNTIPHSFLVDSNGGILADDAGISGLEQLLQQEFGF